MNNLATQYYHKVRKLEKELNAEQKERKKLEKLVKEQAKIIAMQAKRIEELEEENRRLKGEGKKLKGIVFKENTKKQWVKKRGAKKGHSASFRRKPRVDEITETKVCMLSHCPKCDGELSGIKGWTERYSWDIPIPVQPIIAHHRIARYKCSGCKSWVQGLPSGLVPKSPFGINTMMFVLHMKYRSKTTDEAIRETLKACFNLHVSKGTVHKILERTSKLFGSSYEGIKQAIKEGKYVHADETGWRVEGQNWYAWGFINAKASLYRIEDTRGGGVPRKILKGYKGVVVRDGYQGYDKIPTEHQICLIHLLRHSKHLAEVKGASSEAIQFHESLKWLVRKARKLHKNTKNKEDRHQLHKKMQKALKQLWNTSYEDKEVEKIRSWWLEKRHKHLFVFLKHKDVPWENNAAERALRPLVVRRKMSGGSRSKRGAEREAINMSVTATLLKQGRSLFDEIPLIFQASIKENSKKLSASPTC